MTYYEIYDAVITAFEEIMIDGEVLWTEEKCYDLSCNLGMEIPASQFYPVAELEKIPAGQCCKGEFGKVAVQAMMEQLQKSHPHFAEAFKNTMTDLIHYYPVAIALFVFHNQASYNITYDNISNHVKLTVAHERRHAVQPASLFDRNWINCPIGSDEYFKLAHEVDAYAFSNAVCCGDATLEEVETWKSK